MNDHFRIKFWRKSTAFDWIDVLNQLAGRPMLTSHHDERRKQRKFHAEISVLFLKPARDHGGSY